MKTTIVVPLALLTCSVALPPKRGERRWKREFEHYRQHEKIVHAKKIHRRIKKLNEKKHDVGLLSNDRGYHDGEEPYNPAAYGDGKPILRAIVAWPLPVRVVIVQPNT